MNSKGKAAVAASAALAAIMVLATLVYVSVNSFRAPNANAAVAADCRVAAAHIVQVQKGFTPNQYVVGTIDASKPGVAANRGGAFSDAPVASKAELRKQLTAGTAEAKAVIADVQSQVKGTKPSVADVQDVDHWVSVQYKVAVVWPENTTFVGGGEKAAGVLDNGLIGEVSWIYVSQEGCKLALTQNASAKSVVDQTASKRGACLNGKDHPKPKPPKPPNPSNSPCVKPPKPGDGKYEYNPDNCTWRKPGQSFDEQQNGDTGVRQDPQDNTTSGVDTGPTKDDKGVPIPEPTKKPTPPPGNPTPDPTPGGYDTGSNTGGGGNPTTPPDDTGQGGDNGGDPGGF